MIKRFRKKQLDHGYELVFEHKAYAVMFNILDTTNMDKSIWTVEQRLERKNFMTMLVLKIWPYAIKSKYLSKLPKGQVQVLEFKDFDTLLECKNWAFSRWEDRYEADWFKELSESLSHLLKNRYIKGLTQ